MVPGRPSSILRHSLVAVAIVAAGACAREAPPGAGTATSATAKTTASAQVAPRGSGAPLPDALTKMLEAMEDGGPGAAPAGNAEEGPFIGIIGAQGNVYSAPTGAREARIGYIRRGGKVAADPHPQKGRNCEEGWYHLKPLGYVCGKVATLDLENPQVRLGMHPPSLEDVLPYKYAFNVSHGTPLYRNVPSAAEMAEYEPYLKSSRAKDDAADKEPPKKKKRRKKGSGEDAMREEAPAPSPETPAQPQSATPTDADAGPPTRTPGSAPQLGSVATDGDAGTRADNALDGGVDASAEDDKRPWWQRKYDAGKGPDVKLSDLTEDSDKTLARRMVKGFYVAIDRTFLMNNRMWHKTTAGLIGPADRFAIVKPTGFHGEEIPAEHAAHPVAFVTAKTAAKYTLEGKTLKSAGSMERYERAFLSGKTGTHGGRAFHETVDGAWLRDSDIGWTDPGAMPGSVKEHEKWVDVNLSRQTVVAFEGSRPVFATLASTGRKGRDKEHDHSTPTGAWRVREKHIAATMDGDGAAAGDVPYSIEDVPYILYFHESYALHGAFWHDNFGRPQSHGCVNLAPLDAKRIFFWSDPQIPRGWHGMISSGDQPGTLVVVHE